MDGLDFVNKAMLQETENGKQVSVLLQRLKEIVEKESDRQGWHSFSYRGIRMNCEYHNLFIILDRLEDVLIETKDAAIKQYIDHWKEIKQIL